MTAGYLKTVSGKIQAIGFLTIFKRDDWVILVPVLFYLTLLCFTRFLAIPLKSENNVKSSFLFELIDRDSGDDIFNSFHRQESSSGDKTEPYFTLEEIFHKADTNNDGYLSTEEVSAWINTKTQEHIHKAIVENYGEFTAIDVQPRNGVISWEEYHSFFLHTHGMTKNYIMNHNEIHSELSSDVKEEINKDRAAWSEAAKTDPDQLTLDEFLAFRHPESSHSTILSLVQELFDKFDRDGDDILTEDEFSSLELDNENERLSVQSQGEAERRREFREVIDRNKDGRATRKELLFYIDPKNPRHAKEEAETLVVLADMDHDGRLSLLEVFNKMDLFLGSKMVDTARSFHDEF